MVISLTPDLNIFKTIFDFSQTCFSFPAPCVALHFFEILEYPNLISLLPPFRKLARPMDSTSSVYFLGCPGYNLTNSFSSELIPQAVGFFLYPAHPHPSSCYRIGKSYICLQRKTSQFKIQLSLSNIYLECCVK